MPTDPELLTEFLAWLDRSRAWWLKAVPHASGVAAEAFLRARATWDPARGPWEPHAWTLMREAVGREVRAANAKKRHPGQALASLDGAELARPAGSPEARDALTAWVGLRVADQRAADTFVRWLTGETQAQAMARLGRAGPVVQRLRRRAAKALGLTRKETHALVGWARGESLLASAGGRVGHGATKRESLWSRASRAKRGRAPWKVSEGYVCQLRASALEKLRGAG